MILIGGKQLEGPKGVSNDELLHDVSVDTVDSEVSTPSKDVMMMTWCLFLMSFPWTLSPLP